MSDPQDPSHSDDEISSDSDEGVVYGPIDPTRDYMSEFQRVHDQVQGINLHLHGNTHRGIGLSSIGAWTEKLDDIKSSESELLEAKEAAEKLQKQLKDCKDAFEDAVDATGSDQKLAKYIVRDEQEKHNNLVEMIKDFLPKAPHIIPDLQAQGVDLGAASRVEVDDLAQAVRSMSGQYAELSQRHSEYVEGFKTVGVAIMATKDRIAELQKTMQQKSAELDLLQPRLSKTEAEKQELQQKSDLIQTELTSTKAAKQALQEKLDLKVQDCSKAVQDRDDSLRQLSKGIVLAIELKKAYEELQTGMHVLRNGLRSQRRELHDAVNQLTATKDSHDIVSYDLQELSLEVDAASERLANTQDVCDRQSRELQDTERKLKAARESLQRKALRIQSFKIDREIAEKGLENLRSSHDTEVRNLRQENEGVTRDLHHLRTAHSQLQQDFQSETSKLTEIRNQLVNSQDQLTTSANSLTETRNLLTESDRKLIEVRNQHADSQEQLAKSNSQLAQSDQKLTETRGHLATSQEQLATSNSQLAQSDQKLTQAQSELTESKNQLSASKDQLAEAQKELAEYKSQLTQSDQKLTETRNELTTSKNQLGETQKELAESNTQLSTSKDHLAKTQNELAESKNQLAERQTKLDESKNQLAKTHKELSESKNKLVEAQNELAGSKNQLSASNDQLTKTQTELAESKNQLAETQKELSRSKDELLEAQNELAESKDQLAETQNELTESKNRYSAQEESFQNDLKARDDNQVQAQASIDRQKEQISAYEGMFLRLFMESGKQIDFAKFQESRSIVMKGLETFNVKAIHPITPIHGLTTNNTTTSATGLILRMLLNVHTEGCAEVLDMYQLSDKIAACSDSDRVAVLAMLYALIMRTLDADLSVLEVSVVLLRGTEILLSWVDQRCDMMASLGATLTQIQTGLCRSSTLVGAMAKLVALRFKGSAIGFVGALYDEGALRQCQAIKDGFIIIKEAGEGLWIITSNRDVIFAQLEDAILETFDLMTSTEPLSMEGGGQFMRLVFRDCPLLGPWKTTWWSHEEIWGVATTITDLLNREESPATADASVAEE